MKQTKPWLKYAALALLAVVTLSVTVYAVAYGPDSTPWVEQQKGKPYRYW